jgi:hypothetical protein
MMMSLSKFAPAGLGCFILAVGFGPLIGVIIGIVAALS